MVDNTTLIKLTNRDNGRVVYTIPDLGNLHRSFMPGESKQITMEEVRKLSYIEGGMTLLENFLIMDNAEAVAEILGKVEPEYHYNEAKIKSLLLNGSLDEFKDCIDFAPDGVIELIKKIAVDTKLNDIAKRDYILEKTGFNVTTAINFNLLSSEDDEDNKPEAGRRVQIPATADNTGRRVIIPDSEK